MKIRILSISGLALLAAAVAAAQTGKLAGPVAGLVFDPASRTLRPVQGVPGASLIGDSLDLGMDVSAAFVSPRQDSAFAVAGNSLRFFRFTTSGPIERGLGGINFTPERVVFSPSGTAAALFASGKAQIFTGLPDAPVSAGSVDLSLPRAVVQKSDGPGPQRRVAAPAFAISDDGQYLLHVTAGSVWLLSIHGENRRLRSAEVDGLVAFAAAGHDAALIDRFGLNVIRDVAGSAAIQAVSQPDDSLASPVGVAFSQDGRSLYVASSSARAVQAFELSTGDRRSVSCDCTPATLVPMGNLFRITEFGPVPLWLLDTGTTGPRTVFVPARTE